MLTAQGRAPFTTSTPAVVPLGETTLAPEARLAIEPVSRSTFRGRSAGSRSSARRATGTVGLAILGQETLDSTSKWWESPMFCPELPVKHDPRSVTKRPVKE